MQNSEEKSILDLIMLMTDFDVPTRITPGFGTGFGPRC